MYIYVLRFVYEIREKFYKHTRTYWGIQGFSDEEEKVYFKSHVYIRDSRSSSSGQVV